MLTVHSNRVGKFCDGMSRRNFLKVGSLGLGALTLTDLCRLRAQGAISPRATPKSVVMVYLFGGPSHIDTYDLKPDAPVEYRGLFRPTQTNVPGMQICEHMPRQAQLGDKISIIRNMTFPMPFDTHSPVFLYGAHLTNPTTITFPGFGSILSKLWSSSGVVHNMPGYVALDNYTYTSFLGTSYRPFTPTPLRANTQLNDGQPAIVSVDNLRNLELTPGVTLERVQDRTAMLRYFDTMNRQLDNARGTLAALDANQTQALGMLTEPKVREAFDISREPLRLREAYGRVPQLLLARRLVEAGVPLVQLSVGGAGQGSLQNGWDTHGDNFGRLGRQLPEFDQAVATFISDLYDRGLNDDVLAVIWGEMGRTPRINGSSGRDHWPQAGFTVMAGGGLKMGQVVGATDRRAERAVGTPYTPHNVLSMAYRFLGIDVERTTISDPTGRPHYLLRERNPIVELM